MNGPIDYDNPSKTWTSARDVELRRLVRSGMSRVEIAARIGVTVVSVDHRVSRLKLGGGRRATEAQRYLVLDLHQKGWRVTRIARQSGLTIPVVEGVIEDADPRAVAS